MPTIGRWHETNAFDRICTLCLNNNNNTLRGTPARAAKANVLVLIVEHWGLSVRTCLRRGARREAGCWMCCSPAGFNLKSTGRSSNLCSFIGGEESCSWKTWAAGSAKTLVPIGHIARHQAPENRIIKTSSSHSFPLFYLYYHHRYLIIHSCRVLVEKLIVS